MNDSIARNLNRRWLCIAYAFPPVNRSGTHRTAAFVRGLRDLGWRATVLTVVPPTGEPLDSNLSSTVPADTEILRAAWMRPLEYLRKRIRPRQRVITSQSSQISESCGTGRRSSLRSALASLLSTPDSRTGWILPAIGLGLRAIRKYRPGIIFSTSPYPSAHLIGIALHRLTGIPWVADFRDPWCGNPFQTVRPRAVEILDAWLERCVIRHATRIICNTPTMERSFIERHPTAREKISTILNGIDADVLSFVRPKRLVSPDQFAFVHCGKFYGPRSPQALFEGFRQFLKGQPHRAHSVRLILIGPAKYQNQSMSELAAQVGLEGHVIICGDVAHGEALACCAGADALVLVGASGTGSELQVPQKLFEYMHVRRPMLALIAEDNPAAVMLRAAAFDGRIVNPSEVQHIADAMKELSDPHRIVPKNAWNGASQFERRHRIMELNALFENILPDPRVHATATLRQDSCPRPKRKTIIASMSSMAASANSTVATHATLLPPGP